MEGGQRGRDLREEDRVAWERKGERLGKGRESGLEKADRDTWKTNTGGKRKEMQIGGREWSGGELLPTKYVKRKKYALTQKLVGSNRNSC